METTMNKILLALLLAGASASLLAMEKNQIVSAHPVVAPYIKIKKPQFDSLWRQYEIIAKTKKEDAGIVTYKPTGNFYDGGSWLLKTLRIEHDYRKKGLGFKLFKACLQDIQSRGGTSVTWTVYPLDKTMTESELVDIYRKMIEKVGPAVAHSPIVKDVSLGSYETIHMSVTIAEPEKLV